MSVHLIHVTYTIVILNPTASMNSYWALRAQMPRQFPHIVGNSHRCSVLCCVSNNLRKDVQIKRIVVISLLSKWQVFASELRSLGVRYDLGFPSLGWRASA